MNMLIVTAGALILVSGFLAANGMDKSADIFFLLAGLCVVLNIAINQLVDLLKRN